MYYGARNKYDYVWVTVNLRNFPLGNVCLQTFISRNFICLGTVYYLTFS